MVSIEEHRHRGTEAQSGFPIEEFGNNKKGGET